MINRLYMVANGLILAGFAFLCQPFFEWLYSAGFPILLGGVALHIVLDHMPRRLKEDSEAGAQGGQS